MRKHLAYYRVSTQRQGRAGLGDDARLVIAKLDRLARNVAFVATLMESGIDFVAADMPEANPLTIHILAAVAEHEREAISQRTKEALVAAKRRGAKLGNPQPADSLARGRAIRGAELADHRARVRPLVERLRTSGATYRAIAGELERLGIPTDLPPFVGLRIMRLRSIDWLSF